MRNCRTRYALLAAIAGGTLAHGAIQSRVAMGAEFIEVQFGLFSLSVAVESLETFADTSVAAADLDRYVNYLPSRAREEFQQVLTRRFDVSPVAVAQLTYSGLGQDFLNRLGKIIETPAGQNGGQAIRAALILAASDPEGMSVLGVLNAFPTQGIRIDAGKLLTLERELTSYFNYRDSALRAIAAQAAQEAAETIDTVDWQSVPDLTQRGSFAFTRTTLRLRNELADQLAQPSRIYDVDLYIPQSNSRSRVPLVIISHGLGSNRAEFADMAAHLASYGFAVAVPEHPGSNTSYQQEFLANLTYEDIDPREFVYRPWDIKSILNALATEPTYAQQFDLNNVGIIGHSFGGYTALALAGAPLNQARITADCNPVEYVLNLSTLLQCQATQLPAAAYELADERVSAVMAYSPVTSVLLGPESLAEIQTPVMMIAGSSDFVAPAIPEQIHPFVWLTTPTKHLATFEPASHVSINGDVDFSDQIDVAPQVSSLLTGPDPNLSTEYAHALNAAFMGFYLSDRAQYQPFLGAAYASEFLSTPPIKLHVVSQLTEAQLTAAYGQQPPIPIYPSPASLLP